MLASSRGWSRLSPVLVALAGPVAMLALVLPATASAAPPREVTAAEAASTTCFGMTSSEVFAVRTKHTCDPTTAKCESASYLSRVDGSGVFTTVAYLTYKKGEGRPSASDLAATAKPEAIAKAQAAMGDATMPCAAATPGSEIVYDGGRRKATVKKLSDGRWQIHGDNAREVILENDSEALLWGPDSQRWFVARTLTAPDGTTVETNFSRVDVSALWLPKPRPASSKAKALTVANVADASCRGWVSSGEAAQVSEVRVENGKAIARLERFTVGKLPERRGMTIAERTLPPFITDPSVALASVTIDDLALSNDVLADVDVACKSTTIAGSGSTVVDFGGNPLTATVDFKTVVFTGPRGARVRVSGSYGPIERAEVYAPADAVGMRAVVRMWTKDGKESGWDVLDVDKALTEPALFPLPASTATPQCLRSRGRLLFTEVERKKGGASEPTRLLLRAVPEAGGAVPAKEVAVLAAADLAPGDSDDAILAKVERGTRITLAESYPDVTPCSFSAVEDGTSWDVGETKLRITKGADRWRAARGDERVIGLTKDLGETPRWRLGDGATTQLLMVDGSGHATWLRLLGLKAFDDAADKPEVAMKAPKLITAPIPDTAQRRCLAWDSKNKVAWIARPMSTCWGEVGTADECSFTTVLTEVRKDGYFQRVTLAKDGSDWTHMYAHANGFLGKADLGCIDESDVSILGVPVKVTVDEKNRINVAANDKSVRVDTLTVNDVDPNELSESLDAVFWHPDVPVLVIEIDKDDAHTGDKRYVWVDLARVGIKAK